MDKVKDIFRKIFGAVKKVDGALMHKKVYQIIIAVVFLAMFITFFDCFSSNKVYLNYEPESYRYTTLSKGSNFSQSFEANESTLRSLRILADPDNSRLKSSDKANLKITDKDGNEIFNTDFFLYNANRSYIAVDCDDLKLTSGDTYMLTFDMSGMDKKSRLTLKSHQKLWLSDFSDDAPVDEELSIDEDTDYIQPEISNDHGIGISSVVNIAYYYKMTNYIYAAVHFVVFAAFVALLFNGKIMNRTLGREAVKAFGLPFMILLLAEMLNIESNGLIRIFGPQTVKHWVTLIMGLIVIGAVYFLLYMLTGLSTISAIATSFVFALLAYTNHVKMVMRGDSFMPWDLRSAGIAVKTGSTYYFHVTPNFVVSIAFMVALVCFIRLTANPRYKMCKMRLSLLALAVSTIAVVMFGFILNTKMLDRLKIYYDVYPPFQSYNENGTYLAFLFHLNNMGARGSENNSPEATNQLMYQYEDMVHNIGLDKKTSKSKVKPNVIAIMSEAYCDFDSIRELETSEPQTPYYDELVSGTRDGSLAVSIFGGGTCNSEFEFLTGYSMSSLLPGSSVYTFYVNHETEALPYLFAQEGYRTVALHSFDGDWWERRAKYPLLGFQEFYTRDDFDQENCEYVRRYISDKETFHKITDIYEQSEDPLFLFCVTMQNHADFSARYDNMAYDIKINNVLKEDGSHYTYAENYVSLLRESDDALAYLIEYLKQSDEPTIVVFFGDHLPTMEAGFYDEMLGTSLSTITIEDSVELYNTSYFVWANYDLGDSIGEDGITSPNFLGQDVLDLAGIKSPASRACLRVLENEISAISSIAVYDKEGNPHTDYSTLPEKTARMISDYSFIQYGLIYFDDNAAEE